MLFSRKFALANAFGMLIASAVTLAIGPLLIGRQMYPFFTLPAVFFWLGAAVNAEKVSDVADQTKQVEGDK